MEVKRRKEKKDRKNTRKQRRKQVKDGKKTRKSRRETDGRKRRNEMKEGGEEESECSA